MAAVQLVNARTYAERLFHIISLEQGDKPFSSSHVNQMLAGLGNRGLIHKNRFGKYIFAVPLMAQYIRRKHG